MKSQQTILYWLNVNRGWVEARVEKDMLAAPQGEECLAVFDDLAEMVNMLLSIKPGDFTALMSQIEELIKPIDATEGEQTVGNDTLRNITALISLYVSSKVESADRLAREDERANESSHVYTHASRDEAPTINVKVERNRNGFIWSATVEAARSIEEAMTVANNVMKSLDNVYGSQNATLAASRPVKRGSKISDEADIEASEL